MEPWMVWALLGAIWFGALVLFGAWVINTREGRW